MGEAEKTVGFLVFIGVLLWPLLFTGTSLLFSERQKVSLEELGKVKASLWRLGNLLIFF
jgi:hypothetical protein